MQLHRFIGSQLRRPSGAFGRVVMTSLLNRGNRELIHSTLAELDLQEDDDYLDVGFGGGRSLIEAANSLRTGRLYGVDFSPDVVVAGQHRMRSLIAAGRLDLLTADIADLPFRDHLASKISTMNTIYFWPAPQAAMQSLHRVLAPSGTLAIAFTGDEKMGGYGKITEAGFRYYNTEEVAELMNEAGFEAIQTKALSGRRTRGDFIVSGKRAS